MTVSRAAHKGWPLHQRVSDYLFNMECLNKREAKRRWRQSIKDAWNNCCAYCGEPPIDDSSLTIDHVRPRARGGEDMMRNCAPCCLKCNQDKGSQDWIEWYRSQNFYCEIREQRIRRWMLQNFEEFIAENEINFDENENYDFFEKLIAN